MKLNIKKMMLFSEIFLLIGLNKNNANIFNFYKAGLVLTSLITGGFVVLPKIVPAIKNKIKLTTEINRNLKEYKKYIDVVTKNCERLENTQYKNHKNQTNSKEQLEKNINDINSYSAELDNRYEAILKKIHELSKNDPLSEELTEELQKYCNKAEELKVRLNQEKNKAKQEILVKRNNTYFR